MTEPTWILLTLAGLALALLWACWPTIAFRRKARATFRRWDEWP